MENVKSAIVLIYKGKFCETKYKQLKISVDENRSLLMLNDNSWLILSSENSFDLLACEVL